MGFIVALFQVALISGLTILSKKIFDLFITNVFIDLIKNSNLDILEILSHQTLISSVEIGLNCQFGFLITFIIFSKIKFRQIKSIIKIMNFGFFIAIIYGMLKLNSDSLQISPVSNSIIRYDVFPVITTYVLVCCLNWLILQKIWEGQLVLAP